jgi:hypothetical protein
VQWATSNVFCVEIFYILYYVILLYILWLKLVVVIGQSFNGLNASHNVYIIKYTYEISFWDGLI